MGMPPPGDDNDFLGRWHAIKIAFSKALPAHETRSRATLREIALVRECQAVTVGGGMRRASPPTLADTFAASLNERQEDLAFFDERIEKGLVAKLEGIVGSEFVHMDYGEAIRVLERASEKFEFPVKWGIDLQSDHECYLTEKHAKKPVIVMNYPKAIKAFKAFYMRAVFQFEL